MVWNIYLWVNGAKMKLLIISDVHYPDKSSLGIFDIIEKEKPDNIVLLGDNVDPKIGKKKALDLYREFLHVFSQHFSIADTILLLGDNDCSDKALEHYLHAMDFMNGISLFSFRIGNMFFFHGNIERYKSAEKMGSTIGNILSRISPGFIPSTMALLTRFKYHFTKGYLFLGHIHILSMNKKDIFCGTLSSKNTLSGLEGRADKKGYVIVEHNGFFIDDPADIKLIPLPQNSGNQ